ncbi:Fungalysin/Thermolysin Extracellular metalloproteinase 5 [Quaeritorhiza haematococci]|nr:Fungalysin/Thermolysin Extracellular metalloproteinase 5 [Quaeritorhiza haematococci]
MTAAANKWVLIGGFLLGLPSVLAVQPPSGAPSFPEWYHPPANLDVVPKRPTPGRFLRKRDVKALKQAAISIMQEALSVKDGNFKVTSDFQDSHNGVYHYYCEMRWNNLTVVNADANVNLDSTGQLLSIGASWPNMTDVKVDAPAPDQRITASQAVLSFAKSINQAVDAASLQETKEGEDVVVSGAPFALDAITAKVQYYRTSAALNEVWGLRVRTVDHYFNAQVATKDGSVLAVGDWASNAIATKADFQAMMGRQMGRQGMLTKRQDPKQPNPTYLAVPFPVNDLLNGDTRVNLTGPLDRTASPDGWHTVKNKQGGNVEFDGTAGNNCIAQQNRAQVDIPVPGTGRPERTNFTYVFPVDDRNLQPPQYENASVSNLFFVTNAVHDILYQYGFDERAGNFQNDNFGRGGRGNDAVIANAQDGSGFNNANFLAPPDGENGRMNMFMFNQVPGALRDAALENDIIVHEYVHGLSTRLTGGPDNSNCLNSNQAGAMGEGWSDYVAVSFQMKPEDTRERNVGVGVYVTGRPSGVRRFPYSTSLEVNPHTYADLQRIAPGDVHSGGEVWAAMLYEVYWNMVDKLGFEPDPLKAKSGRGNTVLLQTVIDGMKLQPCNPSFIQARDAILLADRNNNNGAHQCDIWAGFAKRGLGFSARGDLQNANDLPPECQNRPVGAAARPANKRV